MDANQPPADYIYSGPSFAIQSFQPSYFEIRGNSGEFLVRIDVTGTLTYGPHYSPDAAAKVFWESISDDYRKMLRWKAEHPDAK